MFCLNYCSECVVFYSKLPFLDSAYIFSPTPVCLPLKSGLLTEVWIHNWTKKSKPWSTYNPQSRFSWRELWCGSNVNAKQNGDRYKNRKWTTMQGVMGKCNHPSKYCITYRCQELQVHNFSCKTLKKKKQAENHLMNYFCGNLEFVFKVFGRVTLENRSMKTPRNPSVVFLD